MLVYQLVTAVAASGLLFSSIQVFQPERSIIDGLGPSTRSISLQTPTSYQDSAPTGHPASKLKLQLDSRDRLTIEKEGMSAFFVVRNKVLISPKYNPEEGDHNAFEHAGGPSRPLKMEAGDFVLAIVGHDGNVPPLIINHMRNILEGNIERHYISRTRRLAEYLHSHNVSFVSAIVRDPTHDHINTNYTIINFRGQVNPASASGSSSSTQESTKLRNHRDGRPSDTSLGRRRSIASVDLVEQLELVLGKQHEEVVKREEMIKPLDPSQIQTLHTECFTLPTGRRAQQNLVVAHDELRDSSEGVRRRRRPADKHVFAQMIAKEQKKKNKKVEQVDEEEEHEKEVDEHEEEEDEKEEDEDEPEEDIVENVKPNKPKPAIPQKKPKPTIPTLTRDSQTKPKPTIPTLTSGSQDRTPPVSILKPKPASANQNVSAANDDLRRARRSSTPPQSRPYARSPSPSPRDPATLQAPIPMPIEVYQQPLPQMQNLGQFMQPVHHQLVPVTPPTIVYLVEEPVIYRTRLGRGRLPRSYSLVSPHVTGGYYYI